MPERNSPTFDDPDLKAALRRALVEEKAPVALRARVQEMIAGEPVQAPANLRPSKTFWRHPFLNLAAAAIILVCVGLAAWHFEARHNDAQLATAAALPEAFAHDLVVRHDYCAAQPDHHVLKGVADDDFRLMTQKLREQLGFRALAAAAGDGWHFCGASAFCMVGQAHSAHLVFKQNGQSLSIFSVAVSSESWPDGRTPAEGEHFANTQAGHPIVSWIHDGTVYSVVGAGPNDSLKLEDITPIADHIRVALSGPSPMGDDRISVALR